MKVRLIPALFGAVPLVQVCALIVGEALEARKVTGFPEWLPSFIFHNLLFLFPSSLSFVYLWRLPELFHNSPYIYVWFVFLMGFAYAIGLLIDAAWKMGRKFGFAALSAYALVSVLAYYGADFVAFGPWR